MPEKISIIIPAYNCQKTIARTLEAALTAASCYRNAPTASGDGRLVEILIVDDGSTDKTKDEILKFPTVKYLFQPNAGPAAARNLGAQNARGEILFFTDADCWPHTDWIETVLSYFSKPDVAVVAGSYGIANPESRLSRCVHREILFRHTRLMPRNPSYFGSFNFAVRKNVFDEVGGFDPRYRDASGEDNDLSYKISSRGHRIVFAPDALVDHHHPERVAKYLSEQRRHGFWRVCMYLDHPRMARGDGYTFWKDIVETGLVVLCYLSVVLIFSGFFRFAVYFLGGAFGLLVALNVVFGIKMMGAVQDGLFFADVMILRAFARANGFVAGLLFFLFHNSDKGEKNTAIAR